MYKFYSTNALKASGWLLKQLKIQASGLSGNLDKVWRDVRDSAWIGGDAEGWERLPYWLDGFIPLAFLLDDEDMKSRAKRYIDYIIKSQRPDGWICPCSDEKIPEYDTWVIYLITKVLVNYYECSQDESVVKVIYDILKNYYSLLSSERIHLFGWAKARWFECFIALNFIKEKYDEPWITELALILKRQGLNYNDCVEEWKRPLNKWTFETHIVNIAMMLKSEAVSHNLLGEDYSDDAQYLYNILYSYNGTPVGLFTGDECLSGLSPIQGTELCAVVEQMYSYELLYALSGESKWAEKLEILAFNALPAAISDDMWTHQYDQMSNQIACISFPGKSIFRTNNSEAHIFGLEPNYGCCTANFHQGWPKFVLSTYMYNGNDIINVIPVPSVLDDKGIHIELETDYPFKNSFSYYIKTNRAFRFKIRVPSFAERIIINGKGSDLKKEITFDIEANTESNICISYDANPYFINRPYGLKTVQCGSLIFSVPIACEKIKHEYVKNNVERKFPYCDYELKNMSDWNYGFSSGKLVLEREDISDIPFSSENPPIKIKAILRKIEWGLEDGYDSVCSKIPKSCKSIGEDEFIYLYPYGSAKLRMTEMPFVEE